MATAYATHTNFYTYAVSQARMGSVSQDDINAALLAHSAIAEGYISAQFQLPLTSYGVDLTMQVCFMAAPGLLVKRGVNPESDEYKTAQDQAKAALAWFDRLSLGKVRPPEMKGQAYSSTSSSGEPTSTRSEVVVATSKKRGW